MPDVGFGGPSSGGSFVAGTVYSDGIGLPTGRAMAEGQGGAIIVGLFLYIGGTNGSRNGSIQIGSSASGAFTLGQHASDSGTGWIGTSAWAINGGTARVQWNGPSSGPVYVGRAGGGTVNGPNGFSRAGTLGGAYRYVMGPGACTMLDATPSQDGTSCTVRFSGTGDTGDTPATGYRLARATNPSFTSDVAVVDSSGTTTFTGLTPGRTYYYKSTQRNYVTEVFGATGGPWSGVIAATQPVGAFGKIRSADNSFWVDPGAKIRSADNSAWLDAAGKIRSADNSFWLDLG